MRLNDFDSLDIVDNQINLEIKSERKKEVFEQYRGMLLQELLNSQEGKIFFGMMIISSGLLTNSHVNSNTKQEPEPNAMQMSFNEGRRFIGEMIYSLLDKLNPDMEFPFECMREYRKWLKSIDAATEMSLKKPNDNQE